MCVELALHSLEPVVATAWRVLGDSVSLFRLTDHLTYSHSRQCVAWLLPNGAVWDIERAFAGM